MKNPAVFSPRVLVIWLTAILVLSAGSIYLSTFGSRGGGIDAVGPSAYSRSAIGYAGIADLMHRLGVRIVKSRDHSIGKLEPEGVLVIAEPRSSIQFQQFQSLLTAKIVLVVLPKWTGSRSQTRPEWIERAELLPEAEVKWALEFVIPKAGFVRLPPVANWSHNEIGSAPKIIAPMQLIRAQRLRPVVGAADGMLVGELRGSGRRIWILADPDVIENHGLGEPANAVFSVALINALRGHDGNVVFDETVHGYVDQPSTPLKLMFEFPFVLATIQGAILIALLLWATMGRFGAPLSPPAALQFGKHGLIENTAKLFEFSRHQRIIVQRYLRSVVQDVARQLHAPPGMSDAVTVKWLTRVGRARAVDVDCGAVLDRAEEMNKGRHRDIAPLATLAREIYRWKREIIDGIPGHSRHDRGHS